MVDAVLRSGIKRISESDVRLHVSQRVSALVNKLVPYVLLSSGALKAFYDYDSKKFLILLEMLMVFACFD